MTRSGRGNRMELSQTRRWFCFSSSLGWERLGLHNALCLPQAWLWIITMNGSTGQMPSSQSLAASGSMAQTPSWLLTANEVSI